MIIGAEGLGESFDEKRDGDKKPSLTRVTGGTPDGTERREAGEGDQDEEENIREEKSSRGVHKLDIEDEKERQQDGQDNREPREFSGQRQSEPHKRGNGRNP